MVKFGTEIPLLGNQEANMWMLTTWTGELRVVNKTVLDVDVGCVGKNKETRNLDLPVK